MEEKNTVTDKTVDQKASSEQTKQDSNNAGDHGDETPEIKELKKQLTQAEYVIQTLKKEKKEEKKEEVKPAEPINDELIQKATDIIRKELIQKADEDKKALENKISELRQTAISSKTKSGGSASSQQIEKNEHNLSEADKAWIETAHKATGTPREKIIAQLLKNRASLR